LQVLRFGPGHLPAAGAACVLARTLYMVPARHVACTPWIPGRFGGPPCWRMFSRRAGRHHPVTDPPGPVAPPRLLPSRPAFTGPVPACRSPLPAPTGSLWANVITCCHTPQDLAAKKSAPVQGADDGAWLCAARSIRGRRRTGYRFRAAFRSR